MTNHLLRHLIAYVIIGLFDMSVGFGKTKLVKLLYLIDVDNYRRRGATISGLEWRFYHYGPYAFEIDAALKELELDIPQDSVTTETGNRATIFRPIRGLRSKLSEYIPSQSDLRFVDRIIKDWGEVDLNPLLNHVYFFTEPMQHAERGEILDFSTIQRHQHNLSTGHNDLLSTDIINEYKSRFQEAKVRRSRQPLYPAPRFDMVYKEGLDHMLIEESHGLPSGVVALPFEAKEHLRDQRDSEVGD